MVFGKEQIFVKNHSPVFFSAELVLSNNNNVCSKIKYSKYPHATIKQCKRSVCFLINEPSRYLLVQS